MLGVIGFKRLALWGVYNNFYFVAFLYLVQKSVALLMQPSRIQHKCANAKTKTVYLMQQQHIFRSQAERQEHPFMPFSNGGEPLVKQIKMHQVDNSG